MDTSNDMIKAVINGQHALKKEILSEIAKLQRSQEEQFALIDKRLESIDTRLDKQGAQLAFLEDDAPTREEHDKLEKQIKGIEKRLKT